MCVNTGKSGRTEEWIGQEEIKKKNTYLYTLVGRFADRDRSKDEE